MQKNKKTKEKAEFTMYGDCIMTNYVHMLLKIESEDIRDARNRRVYCRTD